MHNDHEDKKDKVTQNKDREMQNNPTDTEWDQK